jgi:LEA14-like dessication related protein
MKNGLLVLGCALMLNACVGLGIREPLNVTIAQFTPIEIGILEQRYAVKVRLLNPNDSEVSFDGVAFDLEINGKLFAKGVSDKGATVPRFGEALIDLQVVSGIQNILKQIREFQKGDRVGFTYRIKGQLHLAGGFGSIPFDSTGEFSFPTGAPKPGS